MPQLSYPRTQPIGFAGQISSEVPRTVQTGVSEESSAEIPYGVVVALGTNQDGVKLPTANTDILQGIAVHSHADFTSFAEFGGAGGLLPKSPINVLRKGRCYVVVEDAVTPASKVYVRFGTDGGLSQKGAFRGTTATHAVELFGAQYTTSAGASGIAEVEVDFLTNRALLDHG